MLPELTEEAAAVDQEFEAEGAPEIQQAQIEFDLAHADFGVPHIAAVHSAGIKVEERIGVQVPAMSGIPEGAEIGVMRSGDENGAPGFGDAVEFFHGGDDVRDVFDDVFGAELVEGIVAEGQAAVVQMAENIGGGGWIHIEADGAGIFCWTAAYVENARQSSSCGRFFNQFSVSHEREKDAGNKIAQARACGPGLFAGRLSACETARLLT